MAKKELIAVHCVIYGKGEQANPNELFSIDESSVDSLIASGAARFPEEAPKAKPAAKPKASKAGGNGKGGKKPDIDLPEGDGRLTADTGDTDL